MHLISETLTLLLLVKTHIPLSFNRFYPFHPHKPSNFPNRSVLFSHVAGFATINAWGSLQQMLVASGPGDWYFGRQHYI